MYEPDVRQSLDAAMEAVIATSTTTSTSAERIVHRSHAAQLGYVSTAAAHARESRALGAPARELLPLGFGTEVAYQAPDTIP